MLTTWGLGSIQRLLAYFARKSRQRRAARASRVQLGIEGLESRQMLTNFVVTTAADVVDNQDNFLSLREAITAANANNGLDGILFSGALAGTPVVVTEGELVITDTLVIQGLGALNTIIDAQQTSRVFKISEFAGDVTFDGLTITNGRTSVPGGAGAAIGSLSSGTLTLVDCALTGNSTTGIDSRGGAIATISGNVLLNRTTISGNSTSGPNGEGGGISTDTGDITVINSTISGNTTGNDHSGGGGIATFGGDIVVTNSTIVFNTTTGTDSQGGGIYMNGFGGIIELNNAIVANNNSAFSVTEDISVSTGTLANSSLIGVNRGTGLDPAPLGSPDFNGNLIGTLTDPIDPKLGPLALNGGTTRTHRLLNTSPAVNAGNNLRAVDQNGNALGIDQVGNPRIFQGKVDMGSFELQTLITLPFVYFQLSTQSIGEGAGVFSLTVLLSEPIAADVTVRFNDAGTAAGGVDYDTLIGPVVIRAGSTSATIPITIDDDTSVENNETIIFTLRDPINATLGDPFVETLTIIDNDGGPTGGPTNITLSPNFVSENVSDVTVGTLMATDATPGDFALFTILPGGEGSLFTIAGNQLKLGSTPFDFETLNDGTVLVNVRATDGTGLTFDKQLVINVLDENEGPSVDDGQTFTVVEGSPTNTIVGTVTATDPDTHAPNNLLRYDIVGGNPNNAFAISAGNGQIRVLNPAAINAEAHPEFQLLVRVSDNGSPTLSFTQTITIVVSDINEAPTIPPNQSLSVAENSGNGTVVGTVIARDLDTSSPNNTLTYSILGGNTNNAFAINPATGQLTVNNSSTLTFANAATYVLQIHVVDGGNPSLSANGTVTVKLVDVNQAPVIVPGQSFNLDENPIDGQFVGTVAASDPDATAPNNTFSFGIAGGNTGGAFAIDSLTGQITVNEPSAVNFETTPQFNLLIRVADHGNPSLSKLATVVVTLNNANDAPVIAPNQVFSVSEAAPISTVVGLVTANDPDAGGSITYGITGGNTGSTFAIDPVTGQITVNSTATLDADSKPSYDLLITVTDQTGLSTTATVRINVTDVNEAPILENSGSPLVYNRSQAKNLIILPIVTVNDPDSPTDLAEVRISLPVPPGVRNPDRLRLKGIAKIGKATHSTVNGRHEISIALKNGVTTAEVQSFLRSITFSTKGAGLSLNHRDIQVQVIDRLGAASNVITQDIQVQA